jgi:hypothetical protein
MFLKEHFLNIGMGIGNRLIFHMINLEYLEGLEDLEDLEDQV